MCRTADNSLQVNLEAQRKMLLNGIMTLDRMPKLAAQAENAERMHLNLMKQTGWTTEQLLKITGYQILALQNQSAI